MNLSKLTYQEIIDAIESITEDYGDFLTQDCADEITEKFYHYWNLSFHGMNKDQAYQFNDMLEAMVKTYIQKVLAEQEN